MSPYFFAIAACLSLDRATIKHAQESPGATGRIVWKHWLG